MEQEKKTKNFFSWRNSDKGDTLAWALIVIWGALIMLAGTLGIEENFSTWNAWGLFFFGIGIIGFVGSLLRLFIKTIPNPSFWDFLFALFFILLGTGNETGWIWAVALLVIGFMIIRNVYQHHK